MKKGLAALLMVTLLLCAAAAVGDSSLTVLLQQYSAEAVQQAQAILPEDAGLTLTEREAEIYRLGFARGYDAAYGTGAVPSAGTGDATLVWIPIHGGSKYHKDKTCRQMIDPVQVTISEAERLGYGPCGVCFK